MAGSLFKSNLHEEATEDGLLDVRVVLRVCGGAGVETDLLLAHNADELLADAVGLLEGTEVEVVAPAPVAVHAVGLEHGEHIK